MGAGGVEHHFLMFSFSIRGNQRKPGGFPPQHWTLAAPLL